jgi:hypothetical protein
LLGHDCRIKGKQSKNFNNSKLLIESLHHGLDHAIHFFDQISADGDDDDQYDRHNFI